MIDNIVPCNGCTACCRDQLVVLTEEDGDWSQYETVPLEIEENDGGLRQLAEKPDGSCVYLGEGGCTIWERRPVICRTFDCRGLARILGRLEASKMAQSSPVIRAGLERIPAMELF